MTSLFEPDAKKQWPAKAKFGGNKMLQGNIFLVSINT
jgi:hypothetical protein